MIERIEHTPKLWSHKSSDGETFMFWCPGCGHGHTVPTPRWGFNGDVNSPTFSPSVRHYVTHNYEGGDGREETLCHYHVKAGKIEYCNDCKHQFNGQTIDMVDIPAGYGF